MTEPRVLYWLQKRALRRVFMPFTEQRGLAQAIVMPSFVSKEGFGVRRIFQYHNQDGLKAAIKKFNPDVLVQCDASPAWHRKLRKYKVKSVFVAHGEWDGAYTNLGMLSKPVWRDFDLLCGGTYNFKCLLKNHSGVKVKIVTNALSQFDVLHQRIQDQDKIRAKLLGDTGFKHIVTFFGSRCTARADAVSYAEDYYRTAISLSTLAKKHGWLVLIKPKRTTSRQILGKMCAIKDSEYDWAREIKNEYLNLRNHPNIRFVSPDDEAYKYFCSDVVMMTGRSTLEIEAALVHKPMIKVCTKENSVVGDDTRKAADFGAIYTVDDMDNLEEIIISAMHGDNSELNKNQTRYTEFLEITCDGKAHKRIVGAIRELLENDNA